MKLSLGRAAAGAGALLVVTGLAANTAANPAADAASAKAAAHQPARALTGATTVGHTFSSGGLGCASGTTAVQEVEGLDFGYTIADAGVLTSFSYYTAIPGSVRAVVLSPSGPAGKRTVLAVSPLQTIDAGHVSKVVTFPIHLTVPAGSTLGLWVSAASFGMTCRGASGGVLTTSSSDPATTTDFTPTDYQENWSPSISGVVEPDADKDGFGDVSQDRCPQSAKTQADCPAPDTTVSKAPKKVSARRKVTIKFDAGDGAIYACAVDKKAAAACTSPFKKKFKYGKHTVFITATSAFGIVETDPAEVKFKIKSAK